MDAITIELFYGTILIAFYNVFIIHVLFAAEESFLAYGVLMPQLETFLELYK